MLCETKNMLCETQNMLYANTYHISKNDLTFHEWNLDFGTLRNLTFHEWNLHFGTSRNLTFHEWNLDFGTSRNLTFHEWNLLFGTSRNLTFHEWNLHFGTDSIPSEPLGTWCKVSGGFSKPPRSLIGRTSSLSGCWRKKENIREGSWVFCLMFFFAQPAIEQHQRSRGSREECCKKKEGETINGHAHKNTDTKEPKTTRKNSKQTQQKAKQAPNHPQKESQKSQLDHENSVQQPQRNERNALPALLIWSERQY